LIDEENISELEIGQNRSEIAFQLDQRAGRRTKPGVHLVRDDRGESGFAQSRRSIKQNMIQRLTALARRLDSDIEIIFDALLPDVLGEKAGAQRQFEWRIFLHSRTRNDSLRHLLSV